ncbi:MAG: alpha/beta hydrolase, partial [Bacteroidetes bacterium]
PTLMLWGERDVALGKELAQPSIELCADGQLIFFPKATHWVQHDEADAVNEALAVFFGGE